MQNKLTKDDKDILVNKKENFFLIHQGANHLQE